MTRTTNKDARIIAQCAAGKAFRNVISKELIVAHDRISNVAPGRIMADVIAGETEIFGFFVAPCACKVLRITANGTPFIDNGAAQTSTVKLTKAVIAGTDLDLCSTIEIGAATAPVTDTAIDAVLATTAGYLDLIEGQHMYGTIVVGAAVEITVAYITVEMEWMPTDNPVW